MIRIFDYEVELKLIIEPIIYIIIGFLIYQIIKRVISKAVSAKSNLKSSQKQRVNALKTLVVTIIRYIVVILVFLAVLSVFGVNVKSILAGLGIGTAIIGLAFKDLATDLIAGFFIITEGSYELGDIIEVDNFMGEVIFLGLRTTRIRDYKGAVKIMSNRHMDNVINYSNNNYLAMVDVEIAYEVDQDLIDKTFDKLFKDLNGKVPNALGDLELWPTRNLGESGVSYRVVVEAKVMEHYATERFLRKEIKKAFDKAGIKIPYKQIEVHNGK